MPAWRVNCLSAGGGGLPLQYCKFVRGSDAYTSLYTCMHHMYLPAVLAVRDICNYNYTSSLLPLFQGTGRLAEVGQYSGHSRWTLLAWCDT